MDQILNPINTKPVTPVPLATLMGSQPSSSSSVTSDALLYVQMLMNKVETFCKAQSLVSKDVNALHYADLLRQIKLIKEKRTTVK